MNNSVLKLECFDREALPVDGSFVAAQDAESIRAGAFEDGYGAGWSDALEQMRNEDALRRAVSEQALQAVAFGFHEARDALEQCFVNLVSELVTEVLPQLLDAALQQHLARELRRLAERDFAGRLEILCAPGRGPWLKELAKSVPALDVALLEEASFTEQQVLIRVDQSTRRIDMDGVLMTLKSALGDSLKHKDISHG